MKRFNTGFLGDLLASEITMSERHRMHLMLMVKNGQLTMQEALDIVGTHWLFLLILFVTLVCLLINCHIKLAYSSYYKYV